MKGWVTNLLEVEVRHYILELSYPEVLIGQSKS